MHTNNFHNAMYRPERELCIGKQQCFTQSNKCFCELSEIPPKKKMMCDKQIVQLGQQSRKKGNVHLSKKN